MREAAGRATSTAGDEDFLSTGTIVVSNGLLHDQILRVLREGDAATLPESWFCAEMRRVVVGVEN